MKHKNLHCVKKKINKRKKKKKCFPPTHLMLETFDNLENKIIILGGGFNVFLNFVLEATGGSPVLKNLLFSKLI